MAFERGSRSLLTVLALSCALLEAACSTEEPVASPPTAAPEPATPPAGQVSGPATTQAAWWNTVQHSLIAGEHRFRTQPSGFESGNRSNNLRAHFTNQGVRFDSRTAAEVTGARLRFSGLGRASNTRAVAPIAPTLGECDSTGRTDERGECLRRLEYRHEGLVEWWENRTDGFEQGWSVEHKPSGRGALELSLAVDNARLKVSPDAAQLVTAGGLTVLCKDLVVRDREGVQVPAHFTEYDGGLRLVVDDSEARYPIEIDPVYQTFSWAAENNQASAFFGFSTASAGDVNGDGFDDVVVGAYQFDTTGANPATTDEGAAYLFLGSVMGLSTTPSWTAESNQGGAYFGYAVAGAGDVNNDGFDDVMVGSYQYDNGQSNEGVVFVYHGGESGLPGAPTLLLEMDQIGSYFGFSVASAGDVNSDGFDDVIVGALNYAINQTSEGGAFIYHGSAGGLGATPARSLLGGQDSASFGQAVSGAGDTNNDGYDDVIIGADRYNGGQFEEGGVFVFRGSASGIGATTSQPVLEINQTSAHFGYSLSRAGNVNGDAYDDIIIGAYLYNGGLAGEGRAFLYTGSATGLVQNAWQAEGNQANANFGISVAGVGDVNNDGKDDVLIGAPAYDGGQTDEGRVYLYVGTTSGLDATAYWTIESDQSSAGMGLGVGGGGDVNGDGYADILVGAYKYNNGQAAEGRAFAFYGSEAGPGALLGIWTAESGQASSTFGLSVASAGDVNDDGYDDVIIGAYQYDSGEANEGKVFGYYGSKKGLSSLVNWSAEGNQITASFGQSVAGAGDVNNDGYDDVIIGAPLYDSGEENEGAAFIYKGSVNGLEASHARLLQSNQGAATPGGPGSAFGISVAGAGDVNNDGKDDVIVGANLYDNGTTNEGSAFVYLGNATSTALTPVWSAESNSASSNYGISVAGAGDVNGDGYDDVIVGASTLADAFVYLGSASGPLTGAAWSTATIGTAVGLGYSVASAGDVNDDTYDDVIVSANKYANAQTAEGAVWVFLGSSGGLATTAAWMKESNVPSAQFGESVAGAGDVNGDGYSDVIIGAPFNPNGEATEGTASVYLGSGSGLAADPALLLDGDQAASSFGISVAGAGDINGDGYDDMIVGATRFDNPTTDEGRAFVFEGTACIGQDGLDNDEDGVVCPWDCNGANDAIYPGAPDVICDGVDNDCSGENDDEFVSYPTSCGLGICVRSGSATCEDGIINPNCTPGAPGPSDSNCNSIDENCNGTNDEQYPGTPTTCGVGACASSGAVTCVSGSIQNTCAPGTPAPSDADCDAVDDDCNGQNDEDFVNAATSCGQGACASTGSTSCVGGNVQNSCVQGTPAASDADCDGVDDDCNGQNDEDFLSQTTNCGVGACAATGSSSCSGGIPQDSCTPGSSTGTDNDCDNIDDDCDGQKDESYASQPTNCGVGACAATGSTSCVGGSVANSCTPGTPAANDATCNNSDDDCSNGTDEDYAPQVTNCGIGYCAQAGLSSCSGGAVQANCSPRAPLSANDATCDGVDDDCDNVKDEDYPVTPTSCGAGACAATGEQKCIGGSVVDTCVAGTQAPNDATCDGVDDDCDNFKDEDYQPQASSCGVGVCVASGTTTCVNGAVQSVCTPGSPTGPDTTCNNTDEDCSGDKDEDYVSLGTSCGVGACLRAGSTSCVNGGVVDSCVAGAPAANDASCNNIDDDCSNGTDEDYAPVATSCGIGACHATGSTSCSTGNILDSCAPGTPAANDTSCNGADNDCNGQTDEDYVPVATNCGVGACARTGVTSCPSGSVVDSCTPGTPAANDTSCNGIDNDCNNQTDEDYVSVGTSCGIGSCHATGSTSCSGGSVTDSCTPGTPAANDTSCNGADNDCSGEADEDYVPTATNCGVGACASTGTLSCVGGAEQNSCSPGTPAANDASCNGIDEDCSNGADDDYVATPTTCGVGACADTGTLTCNSGSEQDSCSPGTPAADDTSCDATDDDCDGSEDEDYIDTPTTCGTGQCASTGAFTCVDGNEEDTCTAGIAAANDTSCNGLDDDCSGVADEDFSPQATQCGVGACASTGMSSCSSGTPGNSCVVGSPLFSDDVTCDGVDDDCSGVADEDYVETPTECGTGACAEVGAISCIAGATQDTCTPGLPTTTDATCNGIDDDCDDNTDEDFSPSQTSCGIGVCIATGHTLCSDGDLENDCTPGEPLATDDTTCDRVDDNCNGRTDEDAVCEPDAGADAGSVDAGRSDAGPSDAGQPSATGGTSNQPDPDASTAGRKNNGGTANSDASVLNPINEDAVGAEDTGKGCACSLPGQRSESARWSWLMASVLLGFIRRRHQRR